MLHSWLTPKARVHRVGDHGFGSFALAPIREGEEVAGFGGFIVTGDQLPGFEPARVSRSIQVGDDLYLLAAAEVEDGDLINHSCEPNCGLLGSIVLVARRPISPGEQLTFDYGTCDASPYDEFDCACGAPSCRGRVTGEDWRDPGFQQRNAGWFSPYITRRIGALSGERGTDQV